MGTDGTGWLWQTDDSRAVYGSSSPTPSPGRSQFSDRQAAPADCFSVHGLGFAQIKSRGIASIVQAQDASPLLFSACLFLDVFSARVHRPARELHNTTWELSGLWRERGRETMDILLFIRRIKAKKGNISLFKLVSQEFDFCNFNSVFATFHCCIRHISRHNFDWHKNCTQNVLIYQSNNLFRNT